MHKITALTFIFLLSSCYKIQDKSEESIHIENIPPNWEAFEYENDYKIEDFWPPDKDSTLVYLLEDFNVSNRDMLLLDVQSEISGIYYGKERPVDPGKK